MKSTVAYRTPLEPETEANWQVVDGSNRSLRQLTVALDPVTGDDTRLTKSRADYSTERFGATSREYPEKIFVVTGRLEFEDRIAMTEQLGTAVVAGVGSGLGQALCRQLAGAGYRVAGLARGTEASRNLLEDLGPDRFRAARCDVINPAQVDAAVGEIEVRWGPASVYVHNAAAFHMQSFPETDPRMFESLWRTMCLGAVHGAQRVLPNMLQAKRGALLFIGATASVKAGANFSAFGSAKFALRGLTQSLARELGPQGIHVAHLIIDGVMWGGRAMKGFNMKREQCLDPESVAHTCLHLLEQKRSAWTQELDIRPDVEIF